MDNDTTGSSHSNLINLINNKKAAIGIIGLGYVGLPLAIHFTRTGFKVVGFDTDRNKVDTLLNGESYIKHISEEAIREITVNGSFDATTDMSRLSDMDCILICVPTPLTEKKEPELKYLINTTEAIARHIRKGQLIILESTTYPGTTEEMLLPRLESDNMKAGQDFFLAFSPEREDPGNKEFSGSNTPKVVGGVTSNCLSAAIAVYETFTKTVPVSSTRAAELTKLLENTYRAVNIALVNELKVLAHKMNIDLFEVIDAAATKPFGFTPFYPGPGLGGHCIPIDPFYLSWKAKEFDFSTRLIHLAGEINVAMPYYIIEKTTEALNFRGKCLNGSKILILGMAYKKDVDDERESPGYVIMDTLIKKGANIHYNDPWISKLKPTRKYNFDFESEPLTPKLLGKMDAVIIITNHSAYDISKIVAHSDLIIDTRNATKHIKNNREKIVMA